MDTQNINPVRSSHGALNTVFAMAGRHSSPGQTIGHSASNGVKTIVIPIYHGMRAKNFFYTDTYRELIKHDNVRLVVAVPSFKLEHYQKLFSAKNVFFKTLDLDPRKEHWFGKALAEIAFNILGTTTIPYKQKQEYLQYGNYPRYILKRSANFLLGRVTPLRVVIRFLDGFVPIDASVAEFLKRHKPSLVVTPDIVFPYDRIFLRTAKRLGYRVLGLVRSWDNITSKGVIQILPDKLILHTSMMKREAVRLVGMPPENIIVTGPPDFDDYYKPMSLSRAGFLKILGIPKDRRVILFTPFYNKFLGSAIKMLNELIRAIKDGRLPSNTHILLRYRPGAPEINLKEVEETDRLTITHPCSFKFFGVEGNKEKIIDWEFSQSDVDLLLHSIYYSDLIISTFSTITIDAAACDKPILCIRFDADSRCKPFLSVAAVPALDHYREIERTGGVELIESQKGLIDSVNAALKDPALLREGRRKIACEQIEFFDGKNGTRAAEAIYKELRKA